MDIYYTNQFVDTLCLVVITEGDHSINWSICSSIDTCKAAKPIIIIYQVGCKV